MSDSESANENSAHARPVWDRGDAIDAGMLAFTVGDDWLMDRRLVKHDIRGSLAHVKGLERVGLVSADDAAAITQGLNDLLDLHHKGEFDVTARDEDVHSAVENALVVRIGDPGKRLHTARSRNEQVAVDVRLFLREAIGDVRAALDRAVQACLDRALAYGDLPLPGYTHLRRAMPSTLGVWLLAHATALRADMSELDVAAKRISKCPLGSGAGYGLPVELDREFVAKELGFDAPEEPVTLVQHSRGRAELSYLNALEAIALDVIKLATDLWLFTSEEFSFAKLPVALTTGSSLMPQKRNPDLIELLRANARQVLAERDAVREVVRDLPSGYHRDFQLLKGPLFRAHDRMLAMLPMVDKLVRGIEFDAGALRAACADPKLNATARALEKAKQGVPFRDAYREESRGG